MGDITGVGISFYVGIGLGPDDSAGGSRPKKGKKKEREEPKAGGYAYGTSPGSSDGGRTSPARGGWYIARPQCEFEGWVDPKEPPKPYEDLTPAEKKDRDFAARLFGKPWKPHYELLLAKWRDMHGVEFHEIFERDYVPAKTEAQKDGAV